MAKEVKSGMGRRRLHLHGIEGIFFDLLIVCFLLSGSDLSFGEGIPPGQTYLLSRLFPWTQDLEDIKYPLANHTFVYASASWPWSKQALGCDTFFLYYEEELYQDLVGLIEDLKQRKRTVYIVLDPDPPMGENNTFLDLFYDDCLRLILEEKISSIINNLTGLAVDGFVVGDEWPRGLNREEITIDRISRYNASYYRETGSWMRWDPCPKGKEVVAEWFYNHSIEAWNRISQDLRSHFPNIILGTNLDLEWSQSSESEGVAYWKPSMSWKEVDLRPYDFVVTHSFARIPSPPSGFREGHPEGQIDTQRIRSLRRALDSLLGQDAFDSRKVFLMLGAHCSYPYIVTPAQMVEEWNLASEYPLAGVGWFTFDLWISGNETNHWIETTSMSEPTSVPMRQDRLLTLKGLLDTHNHVTDLILEEKAEEEEVQLMEECIAEDNHILAARDHERKKRYPAPYIHTNPDNQTVQAYNLTMDDSLQTNPDISGRKVVWEDGRNGNRDIYAYDLDTAQEERITLREDQGWPTIRGRYVVYWDSFLMPRYVWVEDFAARIWSLANISWVAYREENCSQMYIRGLGQNIGNWICIDPGNGSTHLFYLSVNSSGGWQLRPPPPPSTYSSKVEVDIKPTGETYVKLSPGKDGGPKRSFPFQLYFRPDIWFRPWEVGALNRSCYNSWKLPLGLCVYDLSTDRARVLDLLPSTGTKEVLIDDEAGWIGYQLERGSMLFYSIHDKRRVRVDRWGASVNLLGVLGGRAFWEESIGTSVNRTCTMDLASPSIQISSVPYPNEGWVEGFVLVEKGDVGLIFIHEDLSVMFSLLCAFGLADLRAAIRRPSIFLALARGILEEISHT